MVMINFINQKSMALASALPFIVRERANCPHSGELIKSRLPPTTTAHDVYLLAGEGIHASHTCS